MVPGTGVMMNLGMKWFDPEPGHPNSIGGGKRLLMKMSPLVMLRDGRPCAALGSPGARRIPNALAQTVANLVDYGLGIQDAVSAPKLDCSTPRTLVDDRISDEVRAELRRRGHPVHECHEEMGYMSFARPNGVVVDHEAGVLRAGSYPYFHGVAVGL
jgi:gamma-glutamyltranspeptidase/glutathione hydrolase